MLCNSARFRHVLSHTLSCMDEALTRRLRAARAYAGLSQPDLAAKLNTSQDTIKRIELGQRELQGYERDGFLRAVAGACGLPVEFFTEDFARMASMATTPLGQRVLRAGGVYDPETGGVGFYPDHPLYEPYKRMVELGRRAEDGLSDDELDELGRVALTIESGLDSEAPPLQAQLAIVGGRLEQLDSKLEQVLQLAERVQLLDEIIREDVLPVIPSAAEVAVPIPDPEPRAPAQAERPPADTGRSAARAGRRPRRAR